MDERNEQGSHDSTPGLNTEDPSTLLPEMPKLSMSPKVGIAIGIVALLVVLAGVHFSMRPSPMVAETTTETTPGSGVVTITPPQEGAPALVPEIVKDKDGKEYLTGELIVAFRASVPVEEAKKMVTATGATVKQHFTQFPVFLVGISEPGAEGVNKAILRFETMSEVERAEPNYLTGAVTP